MKGWSGVLAGTMALWCVTVWASHEVAMSEAQLVELGVTLAPVTRTDWVVSDRLPARVVIPPQQEWVISAPAGGLVTVLRVGVGDAVSAGQELAMLESPSLISLQRDYLQARIQLRLAEADLGRDRKLFKEGIIAERRYLATRGKYEQARASVDERRQALMLAGMDDKAIAALEASRRLSSDLVVRAPVDGVVLAALAVVGQRVETADPLFRVAQLEPLWLHIRVPLRRLSGVEPGMPVVLPCPSGEARVTLVGHEVDPDTQTLLVRAEAAGFGDCLRPGQFVQVRLKLGGQGARFRLPRGAVVHGREGAVVFVRAAFGFYAIPVKVEGMDEGYAIVSGELKDGAQVAASGLAAIKAVWIGLGGSE